MNLSKRNLLREKENLFSIESDLWVATPHHKLSVKLIKINLMYKILKQVATQETGIGWMLLLIFVEEMVITLADVV